MRTFFCVSFLLLAQLGYSQLVSFGSTWSFYDQGMAPPEQSGIHWYEMTYDATAWDAGPAQLGYGDGDEATVISSATYTGYFRHQFVVNDPADYATLDLSLIYDDGAVIYLNGVEIWRQNMPDGPIEYSTFASSNSGDDAEAYLNMSNTLLTGVNVLAVEVHQRTANSSDISFDFSLDGVPDDGVVVITRGPYLQKANDTSMVVRWRTNLPSPSVIDFGISTTSLINTVENLVDTIDHELFISALLENTKYYYQIRTLTDTVRFPSEDLYFKTYPQPGVDAPLTAWILGDCGTGNSDARNVRNAYYTYIDTAHTDMMLFLGDNAYDDGTDSEYQTALFQNMYEEKLQNTVAWSCLGNHDGHSANSDAQTGPYYDIFTFPKNAECGGVASGTEAYYSFDFGNVHFVVLDSYETDRGVGDPMYLWCEEDLQNTLAHWVVALWHHPAYSKGSHDSDTESNLMQMRANFLPLFESYGVDLVLSGHSHSYERTFFLNGHYGLSSTFDIDTHTVGPSGSGSGQMENTGPYFKAPTGPEGGKGAIYITSGSSGKKSAAPLDHPAMYYDGADLGSCVLSIYMDTLSIAFLRETGIVDDHFTVVKNIDCVPGQPCDDNNACTGGDVFDDFCACRGELHQKYVTNANNEGPGSLRDIIASSCDGDTIHFLNSIDDTIRLESEIIIQHSVTMLGVNPDSIIISGQNTSRIFVVEPSVDCVLSNMTLFGGYSPTDGGAVLNDGHLYLESATFVRNFEGPNPTAWTNHGEIFIKEGTSYILME